MMPTTILWQLTQKCDVNCATCVIAAEGARRGIDELSTFESYKVLDQIASMAPRRFVISGGDPLARRDLLQLVDYACRRALDPALSLSATHNLTREAIVVLRRAGVRRIQLPLNGSTAARHDAVYATPGSFEHTLAAMRWACAAGAVLEINTLVTHRTMHDLAAIAARMEQFRVEAWNLYFIVPIAGSTSLEVITAEEAEAVFAEIARIGSMAHFAIRTVEAPHYRRYLLQQQRPAGELASWSDFSGYTFRGDPLGASLDDVVFITSRGEVRPSEFLPISGGNVRYRSLPAIIRAGDVFVALREQANLKGKCGCCEYLPLCGGSRARAWAVTGDLFASDPLCSHQPSAQKATA